jgi:glycosyltransferase involved in cell wall biosynthesis
MRVAYVCADPGVPIFGRKGCSVHVQELLRAFHRQGAEVRAHVSCVGGEPPPGLEALPVLELSIERDRDAAKREQALLSANRQFLRALQQDGSFDLVYERYSLFSYSAMEYAHSNGLPGILEVNAPLIEEQAQYRTLIDRSGAERAARRVFDAASALVAVSEEVARYLEQFAQARGRVHVVANGVDPERFRPARDASARADAFTVGFVGSLKPWHGLPSLVEAFAALATLAPSARLLIVGDGPERERLEASLSHRGIRDAARFTGSVSHAEVPAWLNSMDVAVAPYPKLSNFYFSPLKIYEYMAAGLPIVASRTGQIANLVEDGVTGLLYEPADTVALFEALDRLRREPELRARLGAAARTAVLRGHTWDAIAKRILAFGRLGPRNENPHSGAAG